MKRAADEANLPKYGVPDKYEFVDEIAKTSVGYLNKKLMRKTFA